MSSVRAHQRTADAFPLFAFCCKTSDRPTDTAVGAAGDKSRGAYRTGTAVSFL